MQSEPFTCLWAVYILVVGLEVYLTATELMTQCDTAPFSRKVLRRRPARQLAPAPRPPPLRHARMVQFRGSPCLPAQAATSCRLHALWQPRQHQSCGNAGHPPCAPAPHPCAPPTVMPPAITPPFLFGNFVDCVGWSQKLYRYSEAGVGVSVQSSLQHRLTAASWRLGLEARKSSFMGGLAWGAGLPADLLTSCRDAAQQRLSSSPPTTAIGAAACGRRPGSCPSIPLSLHPLSPPCPRRQEV